MTFRLVLAVFALSIGTSTYAESPDMESFLAGLGAEKNTSEAQANNATAEVKVIDANNNVYFTAQVNIHIFIPEDVSIGVGYQTPGGEVSVEAFIGMRVIRFLSEERSFHMPVGARVQVTLWRDNEYRYFAEYQRQEILDGGNRYGLLDNKHAIGFGRLNEKTGGFMKIMAGRDKHHMWRDEEPAHEPEKGTSIWIIFGKRWQ